MTGSKIMVSGPDRYGDHQRADYLIDGVDELDQCLKAAGQRFEWADFMLFKY